MKNQKLIEALTEQTSELKALYLEKTEAWAKADFIKIENASKWEIEKWYSQFGIETRSQLIHNGTYVNDHQLPYMSDEQKAKMTTVQVPVKYGKEYRKAINAQYQAKRIASNGSEAFIAMEIKFATMHYEGSIAKLASRIAEKELDQDKLTLSSSRIAMNFETTITDGNKKVKAFTILACGEINKPHYRYLVK